MKKVYYVNGFPNNGFGWRIFWRLVKTREGKIIFADKVIPLEEAMKDKQKVVDSIDEGERMGYSSSDMVKDIQGWNRWQLKEGLKFLNEC